jgi:hypothetical protein
VKTWAHDFELHAHDFELHATAKDHGMQLGKLKWSGRFMELRAAGGG